MTLRLLCISLLLGFVRESTINALIVKGTDASIENFPYVVSLRRDHEHACGGSILSKNWILTAAHCVVNYKNDISVLSVQAGKTKLSKSVDLSVFEVAQIVVHPEYDDKNSWINDIALVKLKEPLALSDLVRPVKLPPVCYEVTGPDLNLVVLGWGVTRRGVLSEVLQKLIYLVVPNHDCFEQHNRFPIYRTQICAADPHYRRSECNGDSGGPLMYQGMQVGIVSWSEKPCTEARFPGVFTKVSHYIKFIYTHTDAALDDAEFRPCTGEGK
ncbi:chymotrypsin-1-like [Sabethes cyaneus]|uniref:chymotrypsin-1-like n=1 Tax=Sabethes cyaneus TaxID=53552 RepID=UPI00237D8E92|nr:chymotrypsin-1-like [Sabethes cyaneus]